MLIMMLVAGCANPLTASSADTGVGVSGVPPAPYKDWDLGGGIVVAAPTYWGIGLAAADSACVPSYGSFSGSAPEDNTLLFSIPWLTTPFASFDLSTQSFEGTLPDGTAYKDSAMGALYLDGAVYLTHRAGVVEASSLAANTGARLGFEGLSVTSADGKEILVTGTFDFDVRVFCAVPVGDPGESGDGDTDDSCVAVQDTPPYKNEECQRLTADFPEDVKY